MATKALHASILSYLTGIRGTVSDPDSFDVALDVLKDAFALRTPEEVAAAGSTDLLAAFTAGAPAAGASSAGAPAAAAGAKDPVEGAWQLGWDGRQEGNGAGRHAV